MRHRSQDLLGRGAYGLTEAMRLTGVPVQRIRRWTQGYTYLHRGRRIHSDPLIATETGGTRDQPILDFLDLMEIRFLDAFRKHGVSAYAIRVAAENARRLMEHPRPFSTKRFRTDGRTILAEFAEGTGDASLIDLVRNQYEFRQVVGQYLYAGVEFDDADDPQRWWPLGRRRSVAIDPLRNFGAPIVLPGGIQTLTLARAVAAGQSQREVAWWYEIPVGRVRDAVAFERAIAA